MQQIEIAGQKAAQELAAAKKQYLQKIVSWQLPETKAKDVVFMVHAQLRRKQKRVQAFYVSSILIDVVVLCDLAGQMTPFFAGEEKQG